MSILIKNGIIVTMDNKDTIVKNGSIFIEDDRIVAIGKTREIKRKYTAEKVIDANWKIVMPGLINAHSHMSVFDLLRGIGTDMTVAKRVRKFLFPVANNVTDSDVWCASLLGCMGNIRMGSTYVIDNYNQKPSIDIVAKAVDKVGIRAGLWQGDIGQKAPTYKAILRKYSKVIEKWHNKADGRIKVWVGPLSEAGLLGNTPEQIIKIHELVEKHGVGIMTHLAETIADTRLIEVQYGKRIFEVLYDLGVLGSNFLGIHGIYLLDKEIDILSRTKSHIIHCPTANMFNADGVAPIPKLLKAGVVVGLGTDIYQDMLSTIRCVTYIHKVHNLNPLAMTAKTALRMATIGNAKAIGQEKEIGSLERGKKADIITINYRRPHLVPLHDPISSIVYCASPGDIEDVIVNGKIIMEKFIIKTVDEQEVILKAQEAGVNLLGRAVALKR